MRKKSLLKAVWVIFLVLILSSSIFAKVLSPMIRKKVALLIVFLFCILNDLSASIWPAAAATPAPKDEITLHGSGPGTNHGLREIQRPNLRSGQAVSKTVDKADNGIRVVVARPEDPKLLRDGQ